MSFGWSAGEIIAALQLLNKVRVALKDTAGASSNYQEEMSFLQSVSPTLTHAEALRRGPLDPDISRNLQRHFELIQPPLQKFLSDAHMSFEASLSSTPHEREDFFSASKTAMGSVNVEEGENPAGEDRPVHIRCPAGALTANDVSV